MEVTGILYKKYDIENVSEKFKKQNFILLTEKDTPYPQYIKFQLTQQRCELLDRFVIGQEVIVSFNLKGREWISKLEDHVYYFNTLEAWRMLKTENKCIQSFNNNTFNDEDPTLPF